MSNEIQKTIPADVMRYERSAFDAALDLIKNRGTSFIASSQKDPLTDKQVALILHVALNNGLDPLTEITWLGRPYVNAQGMLRKAGPQIAKIQTVVPTAEEYESLVKVFAIDDGDTLMAVDVTLTDGSVMREFGSANAEDCAAATPVKWNNGNRVAGKLSRRILANMASTRALRRVCERITKLAIPSEESAYEAQEFVTEIEVAPEPTVAKLPAAAPKKAPKPTPAPAEPAPAVAETDVIETTVSIEPPKTGTKPSKGLALGIRTYITQHRDKFPAHIAVTSAIEDFDTWLASENLEGDGWIAGQCLAAWHKNKATWLSVYGAPDDSEESLFNTLAKFTAAF